MKKYWALGCVIAGLALWFFWRKEPQVSVAQPKPSIPTQAGPTNDNVTPPPASVAEPAEKPFQSACTDIFQKYARQLTLKQAQENFLDDFKSFDVKTLFNTACQDQIENTIDMDRMLELVEACTKKDEERECQKMATLLWLSLTDNEYTEVKLGEIPLEDLHRMIAFRLIDFRHFHKGASLEDKDLLFSMLDIMHEARPDISYGTVRTDLLTELYKADPETWKETFQRVMSEVEESDLRQALTMALDTHEYSPKGNAAYLDYVDDMAAKYPQKAIAHLFHAYALSSLDRWDEAMAATERAEKLDDGQLRGEIAKLRKSIQIKEGYYTTLSLVSWSPDLPEKTAPTTSAPGRG